MDIEARLMILAIDIKSWYDKCYDPEDIVRHLAISLNKAGLMLINHTGGEHGRKID